MAVSFYLFKKKHNFLRTQEQQMWSHGSNPKMPTLASELFLEQTPPGIPPAWHIGGGHKVWLNA